MIVSDALKLAAVKLDESGVIEPGREAAGLLAFTLGRDRTFLIAHPEYELSDAETDRYTDVIARRACREPYQYIVGIREFYGLDFNVTPAVLIPRPETELLVEKTIEIIGRLKNPRFLEIGVGSGCISVSVLKNVPSATAIGVDIAENALAIACGNAEMHGVAGRMDLRISDVYDVISGDRFDAILSNPPYVPVADLAGLQPEVRDFEPHTALTDGGDGLGMIRRIVAGASERLLPGGLLMIEFGFGQSKSVLSMYDRDTWKTVEVASDMQGIPRIVISELF